MAVAFARKPVDLEHAIRACRFAAIEASPILR